MKEQEVVPTRSTPEGSADIGMAGFSVFPEKQVEKSSFESHNLLFRTDFKSETTSKYILDIP